MYGWTDDVIGPLNRTVEGQAAIPAGYRGQIREDVEQAPVPGLHGGHTADLRGLTLGRR